jgi:hypothetical protein
MVAGRIGLGGGCGRGSRCGGHERDCRGKGKTLDHEDLLSNERTMLIYYAA